MEVKEGVKVDTSRQGLVYATPAPHQVFIKIIPPNLSRAALEKVSPVPLQFPSSIPSVADSTLRLHHSDLLENAWLHIARYWSRSGEEQVPASRLGQLRRRN